MAGHMDEDPRTPPRPVPGCATCADLASQRAAARAAADGSAETDATVLLRRHQRGEPHAADVGTVATNSPPVTTEL